MKTNNKVNNTITSFQMGRFIFVAQTGIGVITLPSILAREIGHDAWLSILLTGLVAVIISALISSMLKNHPAYGILDINQALFGKIIGTVINGVLFVYLFMMTAAGIKLFILFLRIIFFPTTPPLIMSLVILLPSLYMVWYGLKLVSRFKAVSLVAYIIILLYILSILDQFHPSFLFPIGEAGVLPILSTMGTTYFAFLGLELVVFFYPEISDKEKALKWHVLASVFSTLFVTVVVLACILVFSHKYLSHQTIPLFNLSRILNAPILERVDLYVIAAWFVAMGCSIRAFMMISYYSLNRVFNLKRNKVVYGIFNIALITVSRIPKDLNEAYHFLEIFNYVGIGVTLFILICLVVFNIKRRGEVKHETGS